MRKTPITFKADDDLREILKKAATDERRNLSNFIINALLTYLEEKHGVKYQPKD